MTVPAHGTRNRYTAWHCRCADCTVANRAYQREWIRAYRRASVEESHRPEPGGLTCLVCGVRIGEHPIKACWREMARSS